MLITALYFVICSIKSFVLSLIIIKNIFARLIEEKIMAPRYAKKQPLLVSMEIM